MAWSACMDGGTARPALWIAHSLTRAHSCHPDQPRPAHNNPHSSVLEKVSLGFQLEFEFLKLSFHSVTRFSDKPCFLRDIIAPEVGSPTEHMDNMTYQCCVGAAVDLRCEKVK